MGFEPSFDKLAAVAVQVGVNLQPGQALIIQAPLVAQNLVAAIAACAYQAGASLVLPFYTDEKLARMRIDLTQGAALDAAPGWLYEGMARAITEGAAVLSVVGINPMLMAGADPASLARTQRAQGVAMRTYRDGITRFATNWSAVGYAAPAWAQAIFPDDPIDEAVQKLWHAILAVSRADQPDPAASWRAHTDRLAARCARLNGKRYDALHFRGPGTDLRVGLIEGHLWAGGTSTTQSGIICAPNIPTEEVFTMPHRDRVEGVVKATKPLVHGGSLIENIEVRFTEGRITQASATRGEAVLQSLIATDEGAARLGEVALVPDDSPVAQSGIIFRNTLFDENAASHIALGQAYAINRTGGADPAAGANTSLIHVDWMIGSALIDVDGITATGTTEPLMRAGAFIGED